MARPIVDDLLDMFPDVLQHRRVVTNGFGTAVEAGNWENIPCQVAESTENVKGPDGNVLKASYVAILAGVYGVDPRGEYRLQQGRMPVRDIVVMHVGHSTDENGPHHETVYF